MYFFEIDKAVIRRVLRHDVTHLSLVGADPWRSRRVKRDAVADIKSCSNRLLISAIILSPRLQLLCCVCCWRLILSGFWL